MHYHKANSFEIHGTESILSKLN